MANKQETKEGSDLFGSYEENREVYDKAWLEMKYSWMIGALQDTYGKNKGLEIWNEWIDQKHGRNEKEQEGI